MAEAEFCCAAVFSDHMVLQREKPFCVFGFGRTDSRVNVEIDGCTAQASVKNGRWSVTLPAHKAGGPFAMRISCGEMVLQFADVLFGEVWFAGGQSNMELELQNCKNGKAELASCANENLRFYNVGKHAYIDEAFLQAERENSWRVCSPDTCADISAVAYFCARDLQQELQVPVGVIDCYWGGTSISCWMPEETLKRSAAGQKYLDDYAAMVGSKTDADYDREMQAYNAEYTRWDEKVRAMRAENPAVTWEALNEKCGVCPWPQPAGRKSPFRPAGLYKTMVQRVVPYTLRGFLYYQGEEDWARCHDYGEMMLYLIRQWRSDWQDGELPFLFVQLPMFISKADWSKGEDNRTFCFLREQQEQVYRFARNTGLAAALDCGEFDNIHPLDKQTVGSRLALQALQKVYGMPQEADSPSFAGFSTEGGSLRVFLTHTAGDLQLRSECTSPFGSAFEAAGEDMRFYPAKVLLEHGSVLLSAEQVPYPVHARYAWYSYGPTPLYGGSGLPALPFRC